MIRLFNHQGVATEVTLAELPGKLDESIWVDLLYPNDADRGALSKILNVDLPKQDDMSEVQISSQLFADGGALYMTTPILANMRALQFEIGALSLILTKDRLITLRYLEPKSIDLFIARAKKEPLVYLDSPLHVVLGLLETMVDRSADVLELIGDKLDDVSMRLFRENRNSPDLKNNPDNALRHLLSSVGKLGDLLGKFRNALSGCERIAIFIEASNDCRKDSRNIERLEILQRDLRVLEQHTDSLQERIIFMLDAVLGAVNIEQNDLFKILSIMSVVLMPPTLIAGIYGMNFKVMPELDWHFGYPLALVAMIVSAILPLAYFKRKGWL